ncbi:hypothetical protein D5F01_LYC11226 [Scomber scombrus]|uniref:Transposase n=1 Tax=Scomber scombrus TaxID=13677 RepID=A0AAV1PZP0_SCOSC
MTRRGKGQKSERSPCEKDFVEKDAGAETAEQAGAKAASAIAVDFEVPATNENILAAMRQMKSAVDNGFDELKGSLSSLKSALSAVSDRVSKTEDAIETHEKHLDELERRHESLASQCMLQQAKLDDLEAHSRRQNICIIGIKEKAENGRPTEFVTKLLPELLGEEHFDHPVDVDRAHRTAAPAKDGKPRAIIARLYRFQVKELVLRLEREKAPLRYDGRPVYIFPDLTSATMKKRMAFQHIKEKCRARNIRCGFRHPARFVVAVNDNTGTFSTPAEAETFLSREAQDWDTDI